MAEKRLPYIAVLCDNILQIRLKTCFSSDLFDVLYFNDIDALLFYLENQDVNVLIVDSSHIYAAKLFQTNLADNPVPVALLVRSDATEWKNFGRWRVDAFIPEESSNLELTARIKALIRRANKPAVS